VLVSWDDALFTRGRGWRFNSACCSARTAHGAPDHRTDD